MFVICINQFLEHVSFDRCVRTHELDEHLHAILYWRAADRARVAVRDCTRAALADAEVAARAEGDALRNVEAHGAEEGVLELVRAGAMFELFLLNLAQLVVGVVDLG